MTYETLNEQNFLTSSRGSLDIQSIPDASFSFTAFAIPGITTATTRQPTPFIDIPILGDKLQYEPLTLDFAVRSDLKNWLAIHDWLVSNTYPESFKDRRPPPSEYSDGTIVLYSAHGRPAITINFHNLVPTSLTEVRFNTTDNDTTIITASATFEYQNYTIDIPKKPED